LNKKLSCILVKQLLNDDIKNMKALKLKEELKHQYCAIREYKVLLLKWLQETVAKGIT